MLGSLKSRSSNLMIVLGGAAVESVMSLGQVVGKIKPYDLWSTPDVYLVLLVLFSAYAVILIALGFLCTSVPARTAKVLAIFALLVAVLAFLLIYPSHGLPANLLGYGDRDDAINQMVRAAVQGANPYGIRTYLGNPASPLLGGALLGAPSVLALGSWAYLNPLVLAFAGFLVLTTVSSRCALFLICALQLNVGFMVDYFVGGDAFTVPLLFACSIAVLILGRRNLGPLVVYGLVLLTALSATSRVTTALAGVTVSLYAIIQSRGRERRIFLVCVLLVLGIVTISLMLSGGPSSWPFTGYLPPWAQNSIRVLTPIALCILAIRWYRGIRLASPSGEMAKAGTYLCFTLIPVCLVYPMESYRLWTFILLAAPWAVLRIDQRFIRLELIQGGAGEFSLHS